MWATKADLLVCKQKNTRGQELLFFTPMANVKFGFFKQDDMPPLIKALTDEGLITNDPPLNTTEELQTHYKAIHEVPQESTEAQVTPKPKKKGRPFKDPSKNV